MLEYYTVLRPLLAITVKNQVIAYGQKIRSSGIRFTYSVLSIQGFISMIYLPGMGDYCLGRQVGMYWLRMKNHLHPLCSST